MPAALVTILIVVPLTAPTAWWNIQIRFAASKGEAMKLWWKNARQCRPVEDNHSVRGSRCRG